MRKSFFLSLFLIFSSFYFAAGQEDAVWSPLAKAAVQKDVVWPPLAKAAGQTPVPEVVQQADLLSWDFGKVKTGQILEHTFVYKNESKSAVKILSTSTSCGCTVSAIKKKKLLPGDSSDIDITLNSKGYIGLVKQFIYLSTDDPGDPIVRFEINAEVEK